MRTTVRRQVAAVLSAVLVGTALLAFRSPNIVLAACTKQLAYQDSVPQATADGAQEKWVYRTLNATDWSSQGFASQVLWVGTDGQQADDTWVEVGITNGWNGQDIRTAYTAHAINYPNLYDEQMLGGVTLSLGTTYTFTVEKYATIANSYRAKVAWSTHSTFTWWTGHNPNTVDYSGGLESTCDTSQINRTYVSTSKFRNKATQAYVTINNGVLVDQTSDPDAGIAWCSSPVTFRYWLNSSIGTGLCS